MSLLNSTCHNRAVYHELALTIYYTQHLFISCDVTVFDQHLEGELLRMVNISLFVFYTATWSCPDQLVPVTLPGEGLCIRQSASDSILSKRSLLLPFMKVPHPLQQTTTSKETKASSNDIKVIGQSLGIEPEDSSEIGSSTRKNESVVYGSSSTNDTKLTTAKERLSGKHNHRDAFWVEFVAEKPQKNTTNAIGFTPYPLSSVISTRKAKKVWCTQYPNEHTVS